jgi:4'-phosphopantetheinyl transferase
MLNSSSYPTDFTEYYVIKKFEISAKINDILTTNELSFCLVQASLSGITNIRNTFLHESEEKRFQEYSHNLRKKSFLLGRFAAKKALRNYMSNNCKETEFCIKNSVTGEPIIEDKGLTISISHSGNIGAAIVTSNFIKIGLDIEHALNFLEIDNCFYSEAEFELLSNVYIGYNKYIIKGFIWAAKESLVKFLGIGFTIPLNILEVSAATYKDSMLHLNFKNFTTIITTLVHCENIILAISTSKSIPIPNISNYIKNV